MAKKYKSKVNFNIKKAPLMKYKNGGDGAAPEALGEIEMKGTPLFDNPITTNGEGMSKVNSIDTSSFGSEDSGDAGGAVATASMAAGKVIGSAADFVKIPSLDKFSSDNYGGSQGQVHANKAIKAQKNGNIAAKTLASAAPAAMMIPVAGPFIAAGLGIAAGFAKLGGNIRAKRQGNKAIDFGESYEKREGNSEMGNDYLASIGETTYKNGGDSKSNPVEGPMIANVLMERNKNKEFVDRVYNPQNYPDKVIKNADGSVSTHLMSWGEDDKGQAYMKPTLFNEKNESMKIPNQYADYMSEEGYKTVGQFKNGGDTENKNSELVKFFGPSHDKGGINIGGGKEVEGGETMKDGFVHSDQIGYDKKGMPTFDPSKTKVTFADRTKKIDKMFSDRNDSISNKTKESLYAKVEADNRKVGPIADALNGSPSAEGKFLFGKELEEPESLFSNNFNYSKNFGVDKTDLFFKKFGPNEFLAKTSGFKTGNGTGFIPKYPIKSTEKVKKTNPTTEEKIKLTPGDYMGMVSNAPSIINNLAQGMKKAEREKLQLNPEADTIKQMMADRKINFQSLSNELTKERTAGAQDIGNNTRSVGSRNANLQALYANSAEKKAGINLQGQSANNAYRGEEAGVLNSIGAQEAAERVRKQTVDSQNKAVKQNFKNEAFSGMSKQLASTSEILNSNSTNNVTAASVNALSLKYQLDKSVINKLIGQGKTLKEAEEMVKWYKDMEK